MSCQPAPIARDADGESTVYLGPSLSGDSRMRNRKGLLGAWMILLLATVASAADAPPSLTGSWKLEILSPQGTRTPLMTLTQNSTEVSGSYKSMRGDVPIGGTIQGN